LRAAAKKPSPQPHTKKNPDDMEIDPFWHQPTIQSDWFGRSQQEDVGGELAAMYGKGGKAWRKGQTEEKAKETARANTRGVGWQPCIKAKIMVKTWQH